MWFQKYLVFLLMPKHSVQYLAPYIIWIILSILICPTIFLIYKNTTVILEWTLLSVTLSPIVFSLILDFKGILFSIVVLVISANVLKFSTLYMSHDVYIKRFTILVLLFVLSINLLIYIPHFIIILLGWDGLGIVSFILVVYYQNPKSLAAGIITAITNRVGDVLLLLAIALTLNQAHWSITNIWSSTFNIIQVLMIITAAITKSAQIPFSRWLPAAIAAPTPVSALVHSSTLVTAGVFLIIRFYPFLHTIILFNKIILIVAVITILIAGLSATTECDIKKIIALSTLSQLGIMITRIGLNLPTLAYFHMVTHALFKALLFICAGTFINRHRHRQDLRWIGNILKQIPITTACITVANIALCAFPFMSGFYSKDLILEAALFNSHNIWILLLIFLAVGLTSFYRIRFMFAVVWRPNNSRPYMLIEEPKSVTSPILYLAILSVAAGAIIIWIIPTYINTIVISTTDKFLPLTFTIFGCITGGLISYNKSFIINQKLHYMSSLIWFLVPISSQLVIKIPFSLGKNYLVLIDQSWIELIGGYGTHISIINKSNRLYTFITGASNNIIVISLMSTITIALVLSIILLNISKCACRFRPDKRFFFPCLIVIYIKIL